MLARSNDSLSLSLSLSLFSLVGDQVDPEKPAGARAHNLGLYHDAVRFAMKEISQESKSGGVVGGGKGSKDDRLKKTPVVLVVSSEGIRCETLVHYGLGPTRLELALLDLIAE